jgi:hypothetical protein
MGENGVSYGRGSDCAGIGTWLHPIHKRLIINIGREAFFSPRKVATHPPLASGFSPE